MQNANRQIVGSEMGALGFDRKLVHLRLSDYLANLREGRPRSSRRARRDPRAAHVGRISHEKNIIGLLGAFATVARDIADSKLILIGDGAAMDDVATFLRENRLENRVERYGMIDRQKLLREDLYRLGAVFVTASETETQGLCVLEAMSMGLPIVAVAKGAIPEVVRHQCNGLLAPEPSDLAPLMRELLEDESLRHRLSDRRDVMRNCTTSEASPFNWKQSIRVSFQSTTLPQSVNLQSRNREQVWRLKFDCPNKVVFGNHSANGFLIRFCWFPGSSLGAGQDGVNLGVAPQRLLRERRPCPR